jgi:hypothetical protein
MRTTPVPGLLLDSYGRPLYTASVRSPGSPRVRIMGGIGSGAPIFTGRFEWDDPLELREPMRRHEQYRKMWHTDAYIAEVVRENSLPLLSRATWDLKAGEEHEKTAEPDPNTGMLRVKEKETPESTRAQEARDLVASNLYLDECEEYGREYWSRSPWTQRLREILTMIPHGFSIFYVTERVVNGKRIFDRFLWLEPSSIDRWIFNANDELVAVSRQYRKADGTSVTNEELPAENLVLYTWDLIGARVEGLPLTRPLFGPWKRKDFLLRCKMLAAQRSGVGMPWAKRDGTMDGDNGDQLEDDIETFIQSSFGSGIEHGYLSSANPSLEFGYLRQESADLAVFDTLVTQENLHYAHGGSTKSGMIGELPGGARATAETQSSDKYVMVEAVGQMIAEMELRGCAGLRGPIAYLVDSNLANVKKYPYLELSGVDPQQNERDLKGLGQAKKDGLIQARPEIERVVLKRFGLDLPDEVLNQPPPMAPPAGEPGTPGAVKLPAAAAPRVPGTQSSKAKESRKLEARFAIEDALLRPSIPMASTAKSKRREPTAFEAAVLTPGSITAAMDDGQQQLTMILKSFRRQMVDDIKDRGETGKITRDTLGGFGRSKPRKQAEFIKRTRDVFVSVANAGRNHANEELDRQKLIAEQRAQSTKPLSILLEEGDEFIPPAGTPSDGALPKGVRPTLSTPTRVIARTATVVIDTSRILYDELAEEARVTAELTVDGLWRQMVGEALGEYQRLTRAGVQGPELWKRLEAFLLGTSDKGAEDAARRVTNVAYNQGRDVAIKLAQARGEASWAMRSELLDEATCIVCEKEMDGTMYEIGSPAYEANFPPARCLGQERCRGVMIMLGNLLLEQMEREAA